MSKIVILLGTRPEAIKLVPLILKLRQMGNSAVIVHTGQHTTLADEVLNWFKIKPDFELKIMSKTQSPTEVLQKLFLELPKLYNVIKPDWVVIQGDTSSALAGAQTAFLAKISVAHVEAGLRSHDMQQPFPEEMNRRLISHLSSVHFTPTDRATENLLRENIPETAIHLTGNTVVDALHLILNRKNTNTKTTRNKYSITENEKLILLTTHRRENYGTPQKCIFRAVLKMADMHPEYRFIFPVHPNPAILENLDMIRNHNQIKLIKPLNYFDFVPLMAASDLILTDSGGIQEEAPSLGKPVIILRNKTERPELIEAGAGVLAGTDEDKIINFTENIFSSNNRNRHEKLSLFGDGRASERIASVLLADG
ncbi:MAG: non-hydrolyzing UDP-N-acetylglucosamine 2-epimerase [Balneolaceae bacterium]